MRTEHSAYFQTESIALMVYDYLLIEHRDLAIIVHFNKVKNGYRIEWEYYD